MFKLSDFKVGQKAYVELTGNAARGKTSEEELIRECIIESVGRKYITTSLGRKFEETDLAYDGLIEHTDFCVDYVLYPNKQDILNKFEKKELFWKISSLLRNDKHFSLEQLKAVNKILDPKAETTNLDEIYRIRIEMKELGWESEDSFTPMGWKNGYGYSIWFRRYDWHGKNAVSITGHEVSFSCHQKSGDDYAAVLKTVQECAEKAKKAWIDFPDSIPYETANGTIKEDLMFVPFSEGTTKIRYSEDIAVNLDK